MHFAYLWNHFASCIFLCVFLLVRKSNNIAPVIAFWIHLNEHPTFGDLQLLLPNLRGLTPVIGLPEISYLILTMACTCWVAKSYGSFHPRSCVCVRDLSFCEYDCFGTSFSCKCSAYTWRIPIATFENAIGRFKQKLSSSISQLPGNGYCTCSNQWEFLHLFVGV